MQTCDCCDMILILILKEPLLAMTGVSESWKSIGCAGHRIDSWIHMLFQPGLEARWVGSIKQAYDKVLQSTLGLLGDNHPVILWGGHGKCDWCICLVFILWEMYL